MNSSDEQKNDPSKLASKIEAVLFWKAEPVSKNDLQDILECSQNEVNEGLELLQSNLSGRGLTLVSSNDQVSIQTSPEFDSLISDLNKQELNRGISRSALEVLSLVIYRGPISKRDIDHVRGVNSVYAIRNLLIRGLIEKTDDKARSASYAPTIELLSYLGINNIQELENFESVKSQIEEFMSSEPQEAQNNES